MIRSRFLLLVLLASLLTPVGCQKHAAPVVDTGPPVVTVSTPLEKTVIDSEVFTGRTEAVESVDVRARVSGYLDKVAFKPGAVVKQGDLLFEIDPRPYKAELDRVEAEVTRGETRFERLTKDLERARRAGVATAREELDKIAGDRAEAEAAVRSAKAAVEKNKLDLGFTKIIAPIGGRVSRNLITVGNLVAADVTLLTNIVSLDPIYAYFDVDEPTMLRLQAMIREGKLKSNEEEKVRLELGLASEKGFPHEGFVDFVENRLDPGTGTIRVRGVFPNKDQALSPGLFARIQAPVSNPRKALLVTERALGTDQGDKFVYVVNAKDEVEYRPVRVGALRDGLRIIEEGLKPDDRVIVTGLQRVQPGKKVAAKQVDMPVLAATAEKGKG